MLEEYYSGEEKWDRFVSFYSDKWEQCENKELILSLYDYNDDIAKVIYGIEGSVKDVLALTSYKVPALGGLTPLDCLKDENLKKRLKTMLMRKPR